MIFGVSIILLVCCISSKVMYRFGVPTLVLFLVLGMMIGSDGLNLLYFDDASLAEQISNIALIFIMFYGGFGLDWKKAKVTAVSAGVLASLGVVLTALMIGLFVHYAFGVTLVEGMLLGSIVSSTDAASVFSILNSHKLNLRNNLNYLLEIESGSNDPTSYMLTLIFISLVNNQSINIFTTLIIQVGLGVGLGLLLGKLGVKLINKINLEIDGLYSILLIAIAMLSYSLTSELGGNGFLAVYFTGVIIGNAKIVHRYSMIKYFDGLTWLMQIMLFLTLGLLSFPSQMVGDMLDGMIIAFVLFFAVRPIVIFGILPWFKKYTVREMTLVSWAGFRGAASIVFATYALSHNLEHASWIFNVVFIIALLSVTFQGTLFVPLARKLCLVADETQELTSFYDESGTIATQMLEVNITPRSPIINYKLMDVDMPEEVLVIMIQRDNRIITPKGSTILKEGDKMMLGGPAKSLRDIAHRIENRKIALEREIDYEYENEPI